MEMTTLCYIERDDCYLMLHRVFKKNDVNKDKWIGVGGHFEKDETPVLLSLLISSGELSHSFQTKSDTLNICVSILPTATKVR